MSTDANQPIPGPASWTYMPGVAKKLWLFPALALVLAVIGDVLDYNSNWNFVTMLVAFPTAVVNARMLALKRKQVQAPLITVTWFFLVMSFFTSAVLCVSFYDNNYANAILMFISLVWCSSMFVWGCDVSARFAARKAAGEV